MSDNAPQLHSSIIALISLASGIAAKHPDMGLCQLDKLRHMGIPDSQIDTVIEIARHIRDEAAQKLDAAFDEKSSTETATETAAETKDNASSAQSCCTSTPSGQSCC
jgi:plasmid maintenance system antidote protein VapI